MRGSIDSIIDRQLRRWEHERRTTRAAGPEPRPGPGFQPVITVSRQHGSSGSTIASALAERFGYTLLHRDVIERMSECAFAFSRWHLGKSRAQIHKTSASINTCDDSSREFLRRRARDQLAGHKRFGKNRTH